MKILLPYLFATLWTACAFKYAVTTGGPAVAALVVLAFAHWAFVAFIAIEKASYQ